MSRRIAATSIYEFFAPYSSGYPMKFAVNPDGLSVEDYYENYELPEGAQYQRLFQWVFPLPHIFAHMRKVPTLTMTDAINMRENDVASEQFSNCFWRYHDLIEEAGVIVLNHEISSGRLTRALRSSAIFWHKEVHEHDSRPRHLYNIAESRARRLHRMGKAEWSGFVHEQPFFDDWRAAVGVSY